MDVALAFLFQSVVFQYIAGTGLVARVDLLVLLGFSLFSWAIILLKSGSFGRIRRQSQSFLQLFRSSRKLSDIRNAASTVQASPLPQMFMAGYREIETQAVVSENPGKPHLKSLDPVRRALQISASDELTRLEQWLSWLATTGSVTPFIGLFGTVWGIMDAFHSLGLAGGASLRSVGPGISEALITTAAGLVAAVPAVIAYNQFIQRVKEFGALMDGFALEFLNMTERHFM